MHQHRCCWCANRNGAESSLVVLRADVEHDQEDCRNQDEQEAGDESEIVGFHGRGGDPGEGITGPRPTTEPIQSSSSAVAGALSASADSSASGGAGQARGPAGNGA